MRSIKYAAAASVVLLCSEAALATNGYFSHGVGAKSAGIAGVGIALPQDGLAGASNPAGTAYVSDRIDGGLTWFVPKRDAQISGNGNGLNGSYDGNGKSNFYIPEFGYIKHLSPQWSVGLAIYGNGGMNTSYARNPFFGQGEAGVDLQQLFITPSIAYKVNEANAIGVALNVAYQTIEVKGLQAFNTSSSAAGNLTNTGRDKAIGTGIKLGWTSQLSPEWTFGLTWASKVKSGNFDKYKGLFAEQGGFDTPENYGLGLAYKATRNLTLALDLQEIKFSDVKSVGNPIGNLLAGNLLGTSNGGGFGWRDVTVTKFGVSYDYSDALTLRAGYSHTTQPIPSSQTFFNILAPATIQDHLTLGGTWKTKADQELTVYYAHGFKKRVDGNGSIPASYGGGEANIQLEENILGVAYGWKL